MKTNIIILIKTDDRPVRTVEMTVDPKTGREKGMKFVSDWLGSKLSALASEI